MNNKHLLWWIFDWMAKEYPFELSRMLSELDGKFGDSATATVNGALNEAFKRFQENKVHGIHE